MPSLRLKAPKVQTAKPSVPSTTLSHGDRQTRWALLLAGPSAVAVLWVIGQITGHVSLWRAATDISCPLCGGTRSAMSLMQGSILAAFRYNLIAPFAVLWFAVHAGTGILENLLGRRLVTDRVWGRGWLYICLAFFIAWIAKLVVIAVWGMDDPAL